MDTGIGAAVTRKEDYRFLTGQGNYTDDIARPRQVYAVFVRSTVPHANLRSVDTGSARAAAGVVAVFTGDDLEGVGGVPCGFAPDGGPMNEPPRPVLAQGKVRFVGDMVAVVIARTLEQAKDAAERVAVDYDELPAVISMQDALAEGAPTLHDLPDNSCFSWGIGDADATDAAFARADHITTLELVNNRKCPNAIEPRAAIGEYDAARDRYTLFTTSQNPHVIRLLMGAFVLGIPEHKLRIVSPDVGGGFGSKIPHYPEEAAVTWAAKQVRRPVKWTAERSESFLSDTHGRDHVTRAELACDKDGKFLGMRVHTEANLGAYLSTFGPMIPTYLYATLLAGLYTTGAIRCDVKGVFTNTAPVDAERGAGRPEATYLVERIVEKTARELGLDPMELRRRNFVPADAFPYQTPVVVQYDSGNYGPIMGPCPGTVRLRGPRRAQAGSREPRAVARYRLCHLHRGLWRRALARGRPYRRAGGIVRIRAGAGPSNRLRDGLYGLPFTWPGSRDDICATDFRSPGRALGECGRVFTAIRIRYPSAWALTGPDPWLWAVRRSPRHSTRSSTRAGRSRRMRSKPARRTSTLTPVSSASRARTRNWDSATVALSAYVPHNYPLDKLEPGLDESAFYDPPNFTFPAGCHICEVEVDPETGRSRVVKWTAVDDFGKVINPMIVDGQVHGGIAHGVGQALLENCVYDEESGQLLTGSLTDYCIPRADDLPSFQVDTTETPCPHNPLGVKGCGEAGAIAAPAALINAITDAIGVPHVDMPATPEKVWAALQSAQGGE